MANGGAQDVFASALAGAGVPIDGKLEDLVKHPWAGRIRFAYAPTEADMQTLAGAGFEYDEPTRIAWRKREKDQALSGVGR